MEPTCYSGGVNDQDRAALLADHQAVIDAETAVESALIARQTRMRAYKTKYGRGIVADMARVLVMNRVSVSNLVNPGRGNRIRNKAEQRTAEAALRRTAGLVGDGGQ